MSLHYWQYQTCSRQWSHRPTQKFTLIPSNNCCRWFNVWHSFSYSWYHNELYYLLQHKFWVYFPGSLHLTVFNTSSKYCVYKYDDPANTTNPLHNLQFSEKYLYRMCLSSLCDQILHTCNAQCDAQNAKRSLSFRNRASYI